MENRGGSSRAKQTNKTTWYPHILWEDNDGSRLDDDAIYRMPDGLNAGHSTFRLHLLLLLILPLLILYPLSSFLHLKLVYYLPQSMSCLLSLFLYSYLPFTYILLFQKSPNKPKSKQPRSWQTLPNGSRTTRTTLSNSMICTHKFRRSCTSKSNRPLKSMSQTV